MFVVFEGIDGSGKTTLSNRVAERLSARGLSVKHVRAEGKFASSVTEAIRSLARDQRNLALVPKAEFLLYVAREVQLVEEALLPALQTHDVVIADRYLDTPEVLARFGRQLDGVFVEGILSTLKTDLKPDLAILVDVDPALARARRRAQKQSTREVKAPSRKGLTGSGLQQRLRQGYAELAAAAPERWAVIHNDSLALETAVERVTELIASALTKGVSPSLVEFTEKDRQSASAAPVRDELQARDLFLGWVADRAQREPAVAATFLGGFFGPGADELRLELVERAPKAVLLGARGLVDELSFRLRERLVRAEPAATLISLSGVANDEPRALALRSELAEQHGAEAAASLLGLADDSAYALRERLYERWPDAVLESLATLDDTRAWALRERWLESRRERLASTYELARTAVRSVRGLDDARAWSLRHAARAVAPAEALRSLTRVQDEQSFEWRAESLARAPRPVMESLRGVTRAEAWELRRRVAATCREALEGFAGVDGDEPWALRDEYADVWPCAVVRSLGTLADSPRGQSLLARQLSRHGASLNVRRHAAAIALGVHRNTNLAEND
ncbi:MAG TPA: dTMP kinase [Polyangiaceae bacterium]|nr:dTMP kinase [Polyangiaceae bacterium]